MKPRLILSSLFASLALTACGDKETSTTSGGGSSSGAASCLAKYADNIGGIFPEQRLAGLVDTGGKEAKQNVQDASLSKGVTWSWESDRIRKISVGPSEIEVPRDNQIGVSAFRVLSHETHRTRDAGAYVEQNYRSISAEEMKTIQENMKKQIEAQVESGKLTAEQAKLAGGLGEALGGNERVVETIENIGDACRWVAQDNTLAVGHRDVFFSIHSDLSDDKQLNRDKAIELAKAILAECD